MAFDLTQSDEALRQALTKERQDIAVVGQQTSDATVTALENTQRAINDYADEIAIVNQDSAAALESAKAYTARFNQLQNAGFFERIADSFVGIIDPNRNIDAVGTKVKQSWDALQLAERGRTQLNDRLTTATRVEQSNIDIAGQKLAQQVSEANLIQQELTSRRQTEQDRLQQQQIFLATKSVPELQAGVKSGFITQRQLDEELDRQKRNRISLKSAETSLAIQDVEAYNFHRLEALDKTTRPQVELMREQARANGGLYQKGNIRYRVDELDARLKKFAESETEYAANTIAETEASAAGRTAANRLANYVGLDVSELKPEEAFAVIANRSDVFNPEAQTLIRQAAAIQTAMNSTDDQRARAQMATAYQNVIAKIEENAQAQLDSRFPSKTTKVAISQFAQNGLIADTAGAQELMIQSIASGIPTGSGLYDDILLTMRPVASLAPFGIINEKQQTQFDTEFAAIANRATTLAYNTGTLSALRLVADDPAFAHLNLKTALRNTNSALYSNGKFSIANLDRYIRASSPDAPTRSTRFRQLEEAMQKYLPEAARLTFANAGTTMEGGVAVASINKRIFNNKPKENFIASLRSKMAQLRQQAALEQ